MRAPEVIWTDDEGKRRLVVARADLGQPAELNVYTLEREDAELDAMGNAHWSRMDLDQDVFKAILVHVFP